MDGYFDCWFFHSGGVTAIKMLEAPFWELFNFFRQNQTENETGTVCQLEITMNAGTPREYTVTLEGVWQVVSPAVLTLQASLS